MIDSQIFEIDDKSKHFIETVRLTNIVEVMRLAPKTQKSTLIYGFFMASQIDNVPILEIISKHLSSEESRLAIKLSLEYAKIKPSKSVLNFFLKTLNNQSPSLPIKKPSLFEKVISKKIVKINSNHKKLSNMLTEHKDISSSLFIINKVAQDKNISIFKQKPDT